MLTQHARRTGARLPCHRHTHTEAGHVVLDLEDSMVRAPQVNDRKVCALHDHLLNPLARSETYQLLSLLACLVSSPLRSPGSQILAI